MAEKELLIKIDEEYIKHIDRLRFLTDNPCFHLEDRSLQVNVINAIKNGTPHESVTEFADRCRECGREKVLDKIRAEIEQEYNCLSATRADETLELGECLGLKMSLQIIDKYRAESEG